MSLTMVHSYASVLEDIPETAIQDGLQVDEECSSDSSANGCAWNALQYRGSAYHASIEEGVYPNRAPRAITALQWNPHWECFVRTPHSCGQGATKALNGILKAGFLDFANLVMWADESYRPPAPFSMLKAKCGRDVVMLLYDRTHWRPSGEHKVLCLQGKDRASVVQVFTKTTAPLLGLSVMVVGAHLPHPEMGDLRELNGMIASWGKNVMFIGDTNTIEQSKRLWCELNPKSCSQVISTELLNSCCKDTHYVYKGFDRILANFGEHMQTKSCFESVGNLSMGEFHKGVVGTLAVG